MISDEKLFLQTTDDLVARLKQGSEYSFVKASGLLRLLLLDGQPLAVKASRRFRHKLRFEVGDRCRKPTLGLDLSGWTGPPFKVVTLDRFLGTSVFGSNGLTFTVHDIIDSCAHTRGGVHGASPKTEKDQELIHLASLGPAIGFKGTQLFDFQAAFIVPIIKVTLLGIRPLVRKLLENGETHAEMRNANLWQLLTVETNHRCA